jgi:integrase
LPLADVAGEYRASVPATKHARLAAEHGLKFAAWVKDHRPGVETLQELDPAACRAYVPAIAGTSKTVANTVGDCARIYRVVAPLHGISTDPWRGIRIARDKSREPRGLTLDEAERLLAAATGEYRGAILVGIYTGLRYHDIAFLRWSEVHPDTIRLQPIKTTAHGIRVTVPIHRTLAAYLDGLERQGEFVFPELAATYEQRCTARRFSYARRDAGLPSDLTFHSLRHTVVTWMANARVSEDVRMRVVGHSNAATHSDYTHDDPEQRKAIDVLPELGRGSQ